MSPASKRSRYPLRPAFIWLGVLASLGAAGCATRLAAQAPKDVDLSGHWVLNESLSDDPGKLLEKRRERMPGDGTHQGPPGGGAGPAGGRGPMGGGGPMGGNGPKRGGMPGGGMPGGSMPAMARLPDAPREMNIRQSAEAMDIETEGSSTRYIFGQKSVVSVPDGVADRTVGWKGKAFVLETKAPEGPHSTRRYALDPGGRLIVTTEVSGRGPSLKMKEVYELEPG